MASIPVLLVGFWLAGNFPLVKIVLIVFISASVVLVLDFANSALGADTGLPASILARNCFGKTLSKIVVAVPLILVGWGWFTIQLAMAIKSLLVVFGAEKLLFGPNSTFILLLLSLSIGSLFAFTPITRKLARFGLTNISILFMSLFCLIILFISIKNINFLGCNDLLFHPPTENSNFPLSFGSTVLVGLCASQFVMISDYSRFCRKIFPDSLFVPLLGVIPVQVTFCLISAILGLISQFQMDFFANSVQAGVPRLAFILLFFSQWNAARLVVIYSAGLAGASLIDNPGQKARWWMTLLSIFAGTLLVTFGIQDYFVHFLVIQAMIFPSIGVLLLSDHFLVKRRNCKIIERTNKKALFSLIIGWASGIMIFIYFPDCYAYLGSALIALVLYLLLNLPLKEHSNDSNDTKFFVYKKFFKKLGKKMQSLFLILGLLGLIGGCFSPLIFPTPFGDLMVLVSILMLAISAICYFSQTIGLAIENSEIEPNQMAGVRENRKDKLL